VVDLPREPAYLDVAELLRGDDRCWSCKVGRQVEDGGCRHLWIDQRFAVSHGAGQAVPAVVDVAKDLCVGYCISTRRLRASVARKKCCGREKQDADAK